MAPIRGSPGLPHLRQLAARLNSGPPPWRVRMNQPHQALGRGPRPERLEEPPSSYETRVAREERLLEPLSSDEVRVARDERLRDGRCSSSSVMLRLLGLLLSQ